MSNFNEEAIAKAKQAKSVEDLLTLAKESGVEMTAEQAQDIYAQLHPKSGELSDDELDNVAGGQGEKVPFDLKKYCPDIPVKIENKEGPVISYSLKPLDFIS